VGVLNVWFVLVHYKPFLSHVVVTITTVVVCRNVLLCLSFGQKLCGLKSGLDGRLRTASRMMKEQVTFTVKLLRKVCARGLMKSCVCVSNYMY
jgi:hypothetical protein